MATIEDVHDGLEGVIAFTTEIAEPDRHGGALRYRGVDIEELVGKVPFEQVWGLLVDEHPDRPLLPVALAAAPLRSGEVRADLQAGLATLAPAHQLTPLLDTDPQTARDQLAYCSAAALSLVAASARAQRSPGSSAATVAAPAAVAGRVAPALPATAAQSLAERFLLEYQGESDPDKARALDAYWVAAAEHGVNASTFAARVIASTGADVAAALSGAVGALSGPLHGGAPARVIAMLDGVEADGDANRHVARLLDSGQRLMGFGNRIYRAEDPRARALREVARSVNAPRLQVALELERAALAALADRKPGRKLATNMEFWAAVVLDYAGLPGWLMGSAFACSRTAGWSAHILEQRCHGRLIRPTARYIGPGPRPFGDLP